MESRQVSRLKTAHSCWHVRFAPVLLQLHDQIQTATLNPEPEPLYRDISRHSGGLRFTVDCSGWRASDDLTDVV